VNGVLERFRNATRAFGARFGWNWVGFALSATIVGISLYVLSRLLADIDVSRVVAYARAIPGASIASALFFIGCAYATLTCYDLFALRTIGAYHVPYRVAALASFTSYTIGHNIGATAFSGGAVRYRIYSVFGLTVVDVAKICFLTGLTFWLGNIVVLGCGMVYRPDGPSRILLLPPTSVRVLGAAALVLLAVYVGWAWRKPRGFGGKGWRVVLPGGLSTLVQVCIGVADLGSSSLAIYCLMPAVSGDGFFTLAIAFVSATLLGFASHAPGSLGVFEAAMLVALPAIGKEELVAGVLVFRVLYFMIPFCIALVAMAIWETTLFFRRSRAAADGKSDTNARQPINPPSRRRI
jgi:uncharacterized membrane protein YbhN (UPF0104 family)